MVSALVSNTTVERVGTVSSPVWKRGKPAPTKLRMISPYTLRGYLLIAVVLITFKIVSSIVGGALAPFRGPCPSSAWFRMLMFAAEANCDCGVAHQGCTRLGHGRVGSWRDDGREQIPLP